MPSRPPPPVAASTIDSYAPDVAPDSLEGRLRAALAPNLLLVREIGAGGMARVFLAREPALKRLVAVKVLSGDLARTEAGRARFEREAQAVAGLSHPNVVAVHTVGELTDGTPYFIMQYVDGRSMSERIEREGPISLAEARRALGEVAAALAAAHKQGIIHRDVKPANILYEDATGRSLVSDFGIAAVGRDSAPVNTKLTVTGAIVGTPAYMSPEQLLAEPVTEKTDIYSLGLLAHELLCGSAPFKGSSPHELIAAHLRDVPARLSVRRAEVDTELDAVVARCLEKNAASRPTADEVARRLAPGAGSLLEWPPPGLEELHGRIRRLSGMYMLGGASVTLMMLAIVAAGPTMNSALVSPATLLLLIAAVAGAIALCVAIGRTIRVSRLATHAIKSGYTWMTVLETMADTRGDTGNIVAASREYAGLDAPSRDALRMSRVWREIALLLGGFLAVPLFILVVVIGSSGLAGWSAVWLALLTPAAGLLSYVLLATRERRAFAARRKRRRTSATDVARLAAPWYETFESVRQGQRIGRGRAGGAGIGKWGAVGAAALLIVMVLLLVPLSVVGTLGPAYWTIAGPKYANTRDKVRMANLARPYALPKDSRITPLDAGRAFFILQGVNDRPSAEFPENPLPIGLPPVPWQDPIPAGVFPTARFKQVENIPSPLTIIAAVRRGVSPAEMAYLERIAKAPQWKYYDVVARAPSIDYVGARFRLPFSARANIWAMPIFRFASTKALGYASVTRAAYFLARGDRDSAEAALRGTISLGLLLMDHGNTLIEQLIGAVMVGIGRSGLVDYYKAIGDPRGARLQVRVDSLIAVFDAASATAATSGSSGARQSSPFLENVDVRDATDVRAAIRRTALDANEMRGIRLEMLHMLGLAPCTNLRELVFGPETDVKETFARVRSALARYPSDSAIFELMMRQPETVSSAGLGVNHSIVIERATRVVSGALRNQRLSGCVAVLAILEGG